MNQGCQGGGGLGIQTAAISIGGVLDPPPARIVNVEDYNGTSWTTGNNLPNGQKDMAAGGTTSAGWIAGGDPDSDETLEYDGEGWTSSGNLSQARPSCADHGWGSQTNAIVAGGAPPAQTASEQYNGTSWAIGPSLSTDRDNNSSSTKNNEVTGAIFVGYSGAGNTAATEEFTPETVTLRSAKTFDFD